MLTGQSTEILMKLCDLLQDKSYSVLEWKEIFDDAVIDKKESEKIWQELKFNQCVDVKFSDEDEVCFALTDKARLLIQELRALLTEKLNKKAVVKTDELGRPFVVIEKHEMQKNDSAVENNLALALQTKKPKHERMRAFFWGIFGGIFGGGIGVGIIYSILHFFVGG